MRRGDNSSKSRTMKLVDVLVAVAVSLKFSSVVCNSQAGHCFCLMIAPT